MFQMRRITIFIKENMRNFSCKELVRKMRTSRALVLVVVFIALFLDNMLLTVVGRFRMDVRDIK